MIVSYFAIFGVMKINSSELSSLRVCVLNSQPSSGTRCRNGVRDSDKLSSLVKMPPITVVSPSAIRTDVTARCVLMDGSGWLGGNLFMRRQPGHIAAADNDYGAAIRFTLGF